MRVINLSFNNMDDQLFCKDCGNKQDACSCEAFGRSFDDEGEDEGKENGAATDEMGTQIRAFYKTKTDERSHPLAKDASIDDFIGYTNSYDLQQEEYEFTDYEAHLEKLKDESGMI